MPMVVCLPQGTVSMRLDALRQSRKMEPPSVNEASHLGFDSLYSVHKGYGLAECY